MDPTPTEPDPIDPDGTTQPEDEGVPPTPDPDPEFYGRALARMPRWIAVVAAAALPLMWWRGGAQYAASFLTGAIVGYWNYRGVLRVVEQLARTVEETGKAPRSGMRRLLRLLFIGLAVFVIIRFTRINLVAAFVGLFVPVAAVVLEILYELVFLH